MDTKLVDDLYESKLNGVYDPKRGLRKNITWILLDKINGAFGKYFTMDDITARVQFLEKRYKHFHMMLGNEHCTWDHETNKVQAPDWLVQFWNDVAGDAEFTAAYPKYGEPLFGEGGKLIFEDGYTVSTVLDGDKSNLKVNPHSILHQSPPSDLFVLLDSVASTFYTVSLPTISNETVIKRLAGNGEPGYLDGDLDSAMFNKPRSFTVDFSGNVYVADQRKHSIRKISKTGVSTIAGGSSQKAGRKDGPGRDASFSDDFELTFIPQRCALMVSDHGNRLIRQINLKEADCARRSGSVLGTTSVWLLGLGLSCLFGLIVGFAIRPYVLPHTGRSQTSSVQLDMDTLPNESGETNSDALLRHQKLEQGKEKEGADVFSHGHNKIDGMIRANLVNFEDQGLKVGSFESVECSLGGLVKRR
ncbi:hypothetical protein PHJA_001768600 [Phtheirospermum japonicum]|uniref:Myb/SANT-like domain-containing protein n=1 Tax=Phtheirospermum japonicum TaxID=374723 RepID=A0A830CMF2_9LAMI|nr:hypothetical protein PHJA_001768600 [Phtheirospermum japonicum]